MKIKANKDFYAIIESFTGEVLFEEKCETTPVKIGKITVAFSTVQIHIS